jgi:hypothetical protein
MTVTSLTSREPRRCSKCVIHKAWRFPLLCRHRRHHQVVYQISSSGSSFLHVLFQLCMPILKSVRNLFLGVLTKLLMHFPFINCALLNFGQMVYLFLFKIINLPKGPYPGNWTQEQNLWKGLRSACLRLVYGQGLGMGPISWVGDQSPWLVYGQGLGLYLRSGRPEPVAGLWAESWDGSYLFEWETRAHGWFMAMVLA